MKELVPPTNPTNSAAIAVELLLAKLVIKKAARHAGV